MANANLVILSGIVASKPLCKNGSTTFKLRNEPSANPAQDGRYEVEVNAWGIEAQIASKIHLGDLINVEGSLHNRVEELTKGRINVPFVKARKISLVRPAHADTSPKPIPDDWSTGL